MDRPPTHTQRRREQAPCLELGLWMGLEDARRERGDGGLTTRHAQIQGGRAGTRGEEAGETFRIEGAGERRVQIGVEDQALGG